MPNMIIRFVAIFATAIVLLMTPVASVRAQVKPGDFITKDNATKVQNLVSPGNYVLVQNGMTMKVIATSKLDWPPPFKTATEKYSPQVALDSVGELKNYISGQPFPLLDPNDPQMATKV